MLPTTLCAENFAWLVSTREETGCRINHAFAVTSHFKGTHDGIGGAIKRLSDSRVKQNTWSINNAKTWAEYLRDYYKDNQKPWDKYVKNWTENSVWKYHVVNLEAGATGELDEKKKFEEGFSSIKGTLRLHQFQGVPPSCVAAGGCYFGSSHLEPLITADEQRQKDAGNTYKETYNVLTRLSPCPCSKCKEFKFTECFISTNHRYAAFHPLPTIDHVTKTTMSLVTINRPEVAKTFTCVALRHWLAHHNVPVKVKATKPMMEALVAKYFANNSQNIAIINESTTSTST